MRRKKELQERLAALIKENGEHLTRVNAADFSGDANAELSAVEARETEIKNIEGQIKAIEALEARAKDNASRSTAQVEDNSAKKPWNGFGEFLHAVACANSPAGTFSGAGTRDPRLFTMAPSGAGEAVPSDGYFLVTPDFSNELFKKSHEVSQLAQRCRTVNVNSDRFSAPSVDETSRASGSRWGGVQVYRAAEAATVTAKKPKFGRFEIKAEKLMGIAYATDELIADAAALESYFSQAFTEEFACKLDDEIVNGSGAGECLGLLNAGATIEVAKEAGQAADTIVYENVQKMWMRLYGPSRARAAWFVNQDTEQQLQNLHMVIGTGGVPVYLPPGGATASPYSTLFGRPVVPIEFAATLGDKGDIILADMSQYLLVRKGGLKADQSMHVRFIYDEMTYRWTYRVNGAPGPQWRTALTPAKGSNTTSPFVVLAAR